ncbi:ATP-binding cassette domain-containing protein [Bradyrhizobium sp. NP1]|uniref:ATP-binding cassette domain-containing protein n=1 Tax=Bradyrhizobium sp. NP1 TaxID=3049772 RepID=UPI0025A6463B|nr:ATP-binding cassette domain-containing protein [Bradyrhizobium sp. NP1]WJR79948.1 ATP-binding cassette domain-containing protein [Bradyrhizobium sp. NP1]
MSALQQTLPRLAPSSSPDAITVEHLWKAFHDDRRRATVVAISDVSITVPRGQFVCICGPSGCGKSTLIRILAGLEEETIGNIGIEQRQDASDRPPAMVFQEASLFPWLTVEENVIFPLKLQGVPIEECRQRARELLSLMQLQDFAQAFPYQLSGGMKQRASVARALIDRESNILLMDEPFGALDEQTRMELQQELLRVWERTGKTVVFITHSVEEALTLGDRVIVMSARPGEIAADIAVPFARPRDVLELRRLPEFGQMTFEIWKLLARYKADEERPAVDRTAIEPQPLPAKASPVSTETLETLARPPRSRKIIAWLGKFSPLTVLLLWEIVVKSGMADDRFFPAPSSILSIFWEELVHGPLLADTYATLARVLIGLLIGGVPAIALGLVLGLWSTAREIIAPIFTALYPVPKIATFPLLLMVFGLGEAPKYAVIAIVVFFLVFFNTLSGVRYAPKIYVDVAHNLGLSQFKLFRFVAFPAALPSIFTGVKLAIGTAFVVIAAVEFVGAKTGLGYAIWSSWQIFAVEKMYVNIIAISLSGYLSILLLDRLERLVMPWSGN